MIVSQMIRKFGATSVALAAACAFSGSAVGGSNFSGTQFTTVNSASWTLKGMNGSTFATPIVQTLTGPTTDLNRPDQLTPTDVRSLGSGAGSMYFDVWNCPALGWDFFAFIWSQNNTGYSIEVEWTVTFSQNAEWQGGNSGWTNQPQVSANGVNMPTSPYASPVVFAANTTYTFRWDHNYSSSTLASGEVMGLYFSATSLAPNFPASAVPGSGLAAVGSLGLAGLARRRRR